MIYRGREVDVLSLWSELVDLPADVERHLGTFLPLVKCPNPKHQTEKRHYQINSAQPFVHCFAKCGISGTWEHAIATIKGCTEKEARQVILKHTRIPVGGLKDIQSFSGKRKRIDAEDEIAQDERSLAAGRFTFLPLHVRDYLTSRGIGGHEIMNWNLGYDEETERVVIPALDERQVFKFLIRRSVGAREPKYLYTAGAIKTNILFGLCYLDRNLLQSMGLVLVEGSLDVIRFHRHDFGNTVGILGTGLSRKQVRLIDNLRPKRIYCFFDKDSAGVENVLDVREKLAKYPIAVGRYPADKEDPAELTRSEVTRQLERAIPIGQFSRSVRQLTRR